MESVNLMVCLQIEDGEIYASINQKDGMVCFHDNPEKYNNPAMLHKIDQEVGGGHLQIIRPFVLPLAGTESKVCVCVCVCVCV